MPDRYWAIGRKYADTATSLIANESGSAVLPRMKTHPLQARVSLERNANSQSLMAVIDDRIFAWDTDTRLADYRECTFPGAGTEVPRIVINDRTSASFFVAGIRGLYETSDNGRTWRTVCRMDDSITALTVSRLKPKHLFVASGLSVYEIDATGTTVTNFGSALPLEILPIRSMTTDRLDRPVICPERGPVLRHNGNGSTALSQSPVIQNSGLTIRRIESGLWIQGIEHPRSTIHIYTSNGRRIASVSGSAAPSKQPLIIPTPAAGYLLVTVEYPDGHRECAGIAAP